MQLIAANVDTLFIVTSCNQDFNVARLERYLALAREADVTPVIVLTKADLTDDAHAYVTRAAKLMPGLLVECLDARMADEAAHLTPWCGTGQTVALVGSSGVGKSTLVNTLTGGDLATRPIREDDAHGRHTTSRPRAAPAGGGRPADGHARHARTATGRRRRRHRRRLRRYRRAGRRDAASPIAATTASRAAPCRRRSPTARSIRRAMPATCKLAREDAHNSAALHERRARDRDFGRMVKRVMKEKTGRRGM